MKNVSGGQKECVALDSSAGGSGSRQDQGVGCMARRDHDGCAKGACRIGVSVVPVGYAVVGAVFVGPACVVVIEMPVKIGCPSLVVDFLFFFNSFFLFFYAIIRIEGVENGGEIGFRGWHGERKK